MIHDSDMGEPVNLVEEIIRLSGYELGRNIKIVCNGKSLRRGCIERY